MKQVEKIPKMIVFTCSASEGQCLLRVIVVLVGKKFKIGS